MTSFHRDIARYLQTIGYEYDIVKSSVFHTSKKVLEVRRWELKQSRKGNRPNRAESLSFWNLLSVRPKLALETVIPDPLPLKCFLILLSPLKCPVKMYKLCRANRLQNMSHEDSPFFLGINRNDKSSQWYRSQPMGHDTLGSIMTRMCVAAGLRGKHTNHYVRKK